MEVNISPDPHRQAKPDFKQSMEEGNTGGKYVLDISPRVEQKQESVED